MEEIVLENKNKGSPHLNNFKNVLIQLEIHYGALDLKLMNVIN